MGYTSKGKNAAMTGTPQQLSYGGIPEREGGNHRRFKAKRKIPKASSLPLKVKRLISKIRGKKRKWDPSSSNKSLHETVKLWGHHPKSPANRPSALSKTLQSHGAELPKGGRAGL